MSLPDFTAYTDDKLDAARTAILAEQERRQRLATAPGQVTAIAIRFAEDGGDPATLIAAVQPTEDPSPLAE